MRAPADARIAYCTERGTMFCGRAEHILRSSLANGYRRMVRLIFTSPPFPLNRKKKYGNLRGEDYAQWLGSFVDLFLAFLKPNGSIVMEMGNAWEPGDPVMSTLSLRSLLAFLDKGKLRLCQQFIAYNPARLPSPIQWVNIERVRVKDSFTHIWWMSPSARPSADNRRVLQQYSAAMVRLLAKKQHKTGRRPSGHCIGKTSFYRQNGGAIPSNVLTAANTGMRDDYQRYCREHGLEPHPARMSMAIASLFIKLLTVPRELVLDPFAGSNTTGAAAERLKRRWLSIEPREAYIEGSRGRFDLTSGAKP